MGGKVAIVVYCQFPGCRRFNNPKRPACSNCGKPIKALREKLYYLDYREPSGNRVRERVGVFTNPEEARLRAAEAEIRLSKIGSPHFGKTLSTLGDLATWYQGLEEVRDLATYDRIQQSFRHLLRILPPSLILRNFSRNTIRHYRKTRLSENYGRRKSTTANSTVNREVRVLHCAFNTAVDNEVHYRNPIKGMTPLVEDNYRERILAPGELGRLLAYAAEVPHLRDAIILAVNTGMRVGEVLTLTHGDIDWDRKAIRLKAKNTKGRRGRKKGRTIPIFSVVEEVLKRQPPGPVNQTIIRFQGRSIKSVRTSFKTNCRLAGVEEFWFHDFRRSFATWLERKGEPDRRIMAITGHKTVAALERYLVENEEEAMKVQYKGFEESELHYLMDSEVDSN